MVTGSCQGLEIGLDVESVSFGAVVQNSSSTRQFIMNNTGDIGARFIFHSWLLLHAAWWSHYSIILHTVDFLPFSAYVSLVFSMDNTYRWGTMLSCVNGYLAAAFCANISMPVTC